VQKIIEHEGTCYEIDDISDCIYCPRDNNHYYAGKTLQSRQRLLGTCKEYLVEIDKIRGSFKKKENI